MPRDSRDAPTVAWKVASALIVAAFVIALFWFVSWRSAAPPPPPLPAALR